jgi:hypothetical protein
MSGLEGARIWMDGEDSVFAAKQARQSAVTEMCSKVSSRETAAATRSAINFDSMGSKLFS